MRLDHMKLTLAAGWMSVVCAAGLAGGYDTLGSWTVLVGVALLPSLMMMRQWSHPSQSLSESIREVTR